MSKRKKYTFVNLSNTKMRHQKGPQRKARGIQKGLVTEPRTSTASKNPTRIMKIVEFRKISSNMIKDMSMVLKSFLANLRTLNPICKRIKLKIISILNF